MVTADRADFQHEEERKEFMKKYLYWFLGVEAVSVAGQLVLLGYVIGKW